MVAAVLKATDTKHRILASAIRLFAKNGFSAVSMREIAAAVDISAPALYNHFSSKEALYQAAVSAAFADKGGPLLCVLNAPDAPLLRLERFVTLVTTAVREDPDFRVMLQRELLDGDERRLAFLGRVVLTPIQRPLMGLLRELRPDGDALLLSELVLGMVRQHDEMLPLYPLSGVADGAERSPQQIAEQILQLLSPYLTGVKP